MIEWDKEIIELRETIRGLESVVHNLEREVQDLETDAAIRELGWSRLDIDLHSEAFLLSRHKEVSNEVS